MISSAQDFFKAIPTDLIENIKFRQKLHSRLANKQDEQDLYLSLVKNDWKIAFNSLFWTLDPRKPEGEANQPFLLRPEQIKVVDLYQDMLTRDPDHQRDIGIEKSREEGATELSIKCFVLLCSLYKYKNVICGSKTEDDVDKKGNPFTLFSKIDHTIKTLPLWFRERLACVDYPDNSNGIERTHLHVGFPGTDSSIDGESTNVNFAISKRASIVFLDELGRVEKNVADSMEGSVHDVSRIVVYCSTHWLGVNHTFNNALKRDTTEVIRLPWYKNPEKIKGLYETPEQDYIIVKDIDHYRRKYPGLYDEIVPEQKYHIKDLPSADLGYDFVADNYKKLPEGAHCRSPWHDFEERRRDRRDFASNVWMSPAGASNAVFNSIVLNRIDTEKIRNPDHVGDIDFALDKAGRVMGEYFSRKQSGKLRFWGDMVGNRPRQDRNYVVGADPSLGTGASNSVLSILDRNTRELVGLWVDPNTEYGKFADTTIALVRWLGGDSDAFIVPENNGGHGINYIKKLRWHGWKRIYLQKTEDKKNRKRTNKYGWTNSRNSKAAICTELDIALAEGLKDTAEYVKILIYDKDLLSELYDYIYLESGGIEASKRADEASGARERHGDRVIATALCVLGLRDTQPANPKSREKQPGYNTFQSRMDEFNKEQVELEKKKRKFRF